MATRRTGLTASFLHSFIFLIVIPILMILVAALSFIRQTTLDEAIERIALAQESAAAALVTEIQDAELALAHFLLVNEEKGFELASSYNLAPAKDKPPYARQLTQLFNVMLLPRSNVIALHFYMKDGQYYGLKDDLAVPVESIRETAWYQSALTQKNRTIVDVSEGPVTYIARSIGMKNRLILTAAYSPGDQHRFDQVELACLYFQPKAAQLIAQHTGANMGVMMLVDDDGNVLFDGSKGATPLSEEVRRSSEASFVYHGEDETLNCFVTPISGAPMRIVSAVSHSALLVDFYRAAWLMLGVALTIFVLFGIFSIRFFSGILRPMNALIVGMREARQGDLSVHLEPVGRPEMRHLLGSFNRMMRQIQSLVDTVSKQQEEKRLQEVKVLQAQINPHFLFNTLSSIHFIARIAKFDSIGDMTEALMRILRCAFKGKDSFYTVAEELEVLKSYILLMRIRYADSFEERFEIEEGALDLRIPRFTLQPIVENAIVHGFNGKEGQGHLCVGAKIEGERLMLSVWDDGRGMDQETILQVKGSIEQDEDRYGIGVGNVRQRIALHYGDPYGISFESALGIYTLATITLPIRRGGATP